MLTYAQPPQNIVYNADEAGLGHLTIKFTATGKNVKFDLLNTKTNVKIPVTLPTEKTEFVVKLDLPKGEYKYTISKEADPLISNFQSPDIVTSFSVGKVIAIVGHSLATSNGEKWVTDTRVRIVEDYEAKIEGKWRDETKYKGQRYRTCPEIWADGQLLPAGERVGMETGIWAIVAQKIAEQEDCTVAIINTAMGGSSVKMWADEAMNRPFNHGFGATVSGVDDQNLYNSGIPYFHLENVLKYIVNTTGISAVFVQHGENDMSTDSVTLAKYYREVITTARTASKMPNLPFVLAKSAWLLNESKGDTQAKINAVLGSVDIVLKDVPNTFLGPDTHLIAQSFRGLNGGDDGHFNADGGKEVARLWTAVLTKAFIQSLEKAQSSGTLVDLVVKNPIITANNELANNSYEFPFIVSMLALCVAIFMKIFGAKIPVYLILLIGSSAFGGSYLVQYLLKKKQ